MPVVNVLKVRNPDMRNDRPRFTFGRTPELYLYLLENKQKLKNDATNYDPPEIETTQRDIGSVQDIQNIDSDYDDDDAESFTSTEDDSTDSQPPPNLPPPLQKSYLNVKQPSTDTPKPAPPAKLSKNELLFNLDRLKTHMMNAGLSVSHIPSYTTFTDDVVIIETIEMEQRKLTLSNTVRNYKMWLTGFFMVLQFGMDRFGIPCPTYTQQQILMMSTYEPLLEELAQKRYIKNTHNLGVEARLFMAIMSNTLLIVFANMITNKCSVDMLPLMTSFLSPAQPFAQPTTPSSFQQPQQQSFESP